MSERAERNLDDTTWRALLSEHFRASAGILYSLAHGMLRNRAMAEDVCQKSFLTAWEHRDHVADPKQIRGWLATTVCNESLALLRKRKNERRALRLTAAGEREAEEDDPTPDAEARRLAIVMALGELPEDERAIVALRAMQGIPGSEVGELLGISEPQVSKLYQRGMEKLRPILWDWQ